MPCIHLSRQLWEGWGWSEKTPQPVMEIVGFIKPKGTVSNRLNFVDKINMMHDFKCCSNLNTLCALCLSLAEYLYVRWFVQSRVQCTE